MVCSPTDLPVPFTRDVQDFVKGLFLSGQTELAVQQGESGEKTDANRKVPSINPYRINVQANAACIDLLVWASSDESGEVVFSSVGGRMTGCSSLWEKYLFLMTKRCTLCAVLLLCDISYSGARLNGLDFARLGSSCKEIPGK